MGRKKSTLRKIENPAARQVTFSKRKEAILKKANELGVLCDADVALLLFSPSGRLTCFASNGRVEDILLRFMDCPQELRGGPLDSEELLVQKLRQSKNEAEMLEKVARIEELQEQLQHLEIQKREAENKLRFYDPDVEKINSAAEAELHERFVENAIQRTKLAKAELLGKAIDVQNFENPQIMPNHVLDVEFWNPKINQVIASHDKGETSTARHYPNFHQKGGIIEEQANMEMYMPTGSYPTLSFIKRALE